MVSATLAAPVLAVIGHICGSLVSVPSGKIWTHLPSWTEATARILDAITRQLETIRGEKAQAIRFDSRTAGVAEIGNPNRRRIKKSARKIDGGSS